MLVRRPRDSGLHTLIDRKTQAKELRLLRLVQDPGDSETLAFAGEEAVIVLLQGELNLLWPGGSQRAQRASPFKARASALYLPPGSEATVRAEAASETLIVTAPCDQAGTAAFLGPQDVVVNARGQGGYGREVHDLFVADTHAKRLLVGETFNPPGHWSSFPPHKHDGEDGEPFLEEVYYYRLEPAQGFGYQGLYAKAESEGGGMDEAYTVRDGDAVLIPRGFHPVGAAPGYGLYYFWALAGERRELALFEDPDHVWLHDA